MFPCRELGDMQDFAGTARITLPVQQAYRMKSDY
jgi:hypothetical protein